MQENIVRGFKSVVKITESTHSVELLCNHLPSCIFIFFFHLFFLRLSLQLKKINTLYPAKVNLVLSVSRQ